MNFSSFQRCCCFWFYFKLRFSHFTLICAQRKIRWGKGDRRKKKETALSCSLLIAGLSRHRSNSPTKTSGYFLIPLDDFQMFWLGEHLQFSIRSNTLVAASKSLLIKSPQWIPRHRLWAVQTVQPYLVTQEMQAEPQTLRQAAITKQGLLPRLYLLLKTGQGYRVHKGCSLFFKGKMYKWQDIFHTEKTEYISVKGAKRNI